MMCLRMLRLPYVPVSQFYRLREKNLSMIFALIHYGNRTGCCDCYAEEEFKRLYRKTERCGAADIPEGAPVLNLERTTYTTRATIVD